jgi:hypothetical protein
MRKTAFVIMPFSKTDTCSEAVWTDIYQNVFRPALEECQYVCERSQPMAGSLAGSIIHQLRSARIVLADITDRNPNVFYELGIRHTLKNGTILVTQGERHITSDLQGYWFVNYGIQPGDVARFKAEIRRLIGQIESDPDKSDNPVADYLEKEQINVLGYVRKETIKKLSALYTELTAISYNLDIIRSEPEAARLLTTDCLQLLCNTRYIDVGPDLFGDAYQLTYSIRLLKDGLTEVTVSSVAKEVKNFAAHIHDLVARLMRDEYNEPPVVTTMAWVPLSRAASSRAALEGQKPRLSEEELYEHFWGRSDPYLSFGSDGLQKPPKSLLKDYFVPPKTLGVSEFRQKLCIQVDMRTPILHGNESTRWKNLIARFGDDMRHKQIKAGSTDGSPEAKTSVFPNTKSRRNLPCPCGSGKKCKNCCGKT